MRKRGNFQKACDVMEGFAKGTPWRIVGISNSRVRLRYGDEHPPFNAEVEKARAAVAGCGLRVTVHDDATAEAKGRW